MACVMPSPGKTQICLLHRRQQRQPQPPAQSSLTRCELHQTLPAASARPLHLLLSVCAASRSTHATLLCRRSSSCSPISLVPAVRRCPISVCASTSGSSSRSYPASTTALRGQGAVARPSSDSIAGADGVSASSSSSPSSSGVTSAAGGAWASTSGTWSGAVAWSDPARSEVLESQMDDEEDDDDKGGCNGSDNGGTNNFFAMPAVPQDVVNEFEDKLEADMQTVGVTLSAILGVIIFWRGVWSLLDHLIGDDIFGDVCCALVGLCIVLYIRLSGRKIASFWPPS